LPSSLKHLIIRRHGCKTVSENDVGRLDGYLAKRFGPGVRGRPNNSSHALQRRCGCGRANNRA
jgi:hypothetical protein